MKQEDKKKSKIPEKKWFDIKIESTVPTIITYRIFAENEEEAIKLIKNKQPNNIQYKFLNRRENKITVYDAGTFMIRLVRNLFR